MNKSEQITELAKALTSAQSELRNTPASAVNPHFKSRYTPLDAILDMAREVLPKHGLSILQSVSGASETITVTTMLIHTSGQWLESDPLTMKAEKTTPQGQGSAITYARRYSLSAMLGVATDPDDDGNAAEPKQPPTQHPTTPPPVVKTARQPDLFITDDQYNALEELCKDAETRKTDNELVVKLKEIYQAFGYRSARQIKQIDFEKIRRKLIESTTEIIFADDDTELPFPMGE